MNELVEAVLQWWDVHKYDVDMGEAGDDGWAQEYNRYEEIPEFVKIAQRMKEEQTKSGQ